MALHPLVTLDFTGRPLLTTERDVSYTDPIRGAGLQLHATIGILVVFPMPQYDESGAFTAPSVKVDSLTEEVMNQYMILRGLIGNCVANAESIVNKLKVPNSIIYKQSASYKEGDNTYNIVSLFDFMKLKNNFVDYVKSNQTYSSFETYGKNEGKPFRRELDCFVIYRNIFTHGILRVMMPDYTYCIEYIDNVTKKTALMLINANIINEFNQVFVKFNKLLDDFRKIDLPK